MSVSLAAPGQRVFGICFCLELVSFESEGSPCLAAHPHSSGSSSLLVASSGRQHEAEPLAGGPWGLALAVGLGQTGSLLHEFQQEVASRPFSYSITTRLTLKTLKYINKII